MQLQHAAPGAAGANAAAAAAEGANLDVHIMIDDKERYGIVYPQNGINNKGKTGFFRAVHRDTVAPCVAKVLERFGERVGSTGHQMDGWLVDAVKQRPDPKSDFIYRLVPFKVPQGVVVSIFLTGNRKKIIVWIVDDAGAVKHESMAPSKPVVLNASPASACSRDFALSDEHATHIANALAQDYKKAGPKSDAQLLKESKEQCKVLEAKLKEAKESASAHKSAHNKLKKAHEQTVKQLKAAMERAESAIEDVDTFKAELDACKAELAHLKQRAQAPQAAARPATRGDLVTPGAAAHAALEPTTAANVTYNNCTIGTGAAADQRAKRPRGPTAEDLLIEQGAILALQRRRARLNQDGDDVDFGL